MGVKHTIAYMAPIESISRKFAPRTETCANVKANAGIGVVKVAYTWLGAGVRTGATKSLDSHKMNYFVVRKNQRSTAYSAAERWAQSKFNVCSAQVRARMRNLTTLAADQQAFKAQKDLPNGRKSFYSYIWKLEAEAYDTENPRP